MGAGLGPRFLCVCVDGTTTTQFGEQYCCDGTGEAPFPVSPEQSDGSDFCVVCADGGCRYTLLGSESFLVVDRFETDKDDELSLDEPNDSPFLLFELRAHPSGGNTSAIRPPVILDARSSDSHLRSVILLV